MTNDSIKSTLKFKDYRVEKIEFQYNRNFKEEPVEIDFKVNRKVEFVDDENNTMLVSLYVVIFEKPEENNYPFGLNIEVTGIFELDSSAIEKRNLFAETNAIAILFPYVRALVSTFTANANVSPLLLPPINVVKLIEDSRAG